MSDLKQLAGQMFQQTLAAIDIPRVMQRKLQLRGSRLSCIDHRFVADKQPDGSARHPGGRLSDQMIDEVSEIDLRDFEELRVIAFGKAAHGMMEGLANI